MMRSMISRYLRSCAILLAAFALTQCATSPTGRTQLKLFPDSTMVSMGASAYDELKQNTPVSRDRNAVLYVNCVTEAILREVPSRYRWEVTVFEDKAANAFALPGGKIGVYTGLLKVAENQHQLAAVIGHEIAHVIADHGNARVSTAFAADAGLQLAQIMAGAPSPQKNQLFGLLGLGAQVGILMPYGRSQESEADILGLEYMARAGFDPRASVALWQNMGRAGGGRQPPEFLSTHPSHGTRISDLNKAMPRALEIFATAQAADKVPICEAVKR
jgi:predicted Zn-dependent protease